MDVTERFKGEFEAIEFDMARKTQEAIDASTAEKDAKIAELQTEVDKARDEGREEGGRSAIDEIKRRLGIL